MKSRRLFLKHVSGSALGLALIHPVSGLKDLFTPENRLETENQEMKYAGPVLRVAIMGLGNYGNRVAEAMKTSTRTKLVGVISGTPSKVRDWQARYGIPEKNCYNYENFDAIKNNRDIDAVYIITPNSQHRNQAIRVARAGKQVICEKPMALNAREGQDMIDACNKAGVKLLVGYRMHFEPHTLEIIRMRNAGEFGKITHFNGMTGFTMGNPSQWRLNKALSGGGSLMDIGIYSINGARYMVGEEPIWVTAQETKTDTVTFGEGVDETIQFQFGFPSGATASCLSSYNMNNLDRFFLDGKDGYVQMYPATGYGPIKANTDKGPIDQPITIHQTVQMDRMADIIFDGYKPQVPIDGYEALKDLKIIDAIYEAVKTGQKVNLKL